MTRPRIGLLGGTFDPPHIGHLAAANEVRSTLGLDEVRLVVANDPWQKSGSREITPAQDRLALVRAAIDGSEGLVVSACEVERGGPSYTIDTVEELRASEPDAEVFLIVGADAAAGLDTWERHEDLRSLVTLVIVDRPGVATVDAPEGWDVRHVAMEPIDASSTEIREELRSGHSTGQAVPPSVVACMRERRLYGLTGP